MSYVATVLARNTDGWTAQEVDLDDVEDVDGAVEVIRAVDETADAAVLFVEEEDEYLAIVRVHADDIEEAQVFLSDASAVENFALAALLMDGVDIEQATIDEDDDDTSTPYGPVPAGDPGLLADLGTPEPVLLRLCSREGMLPFDVTAAICERAGCLGELEKLRG